MSGGLAEIRGYLVKGESEEGWLGMCRILEGMEGGEREIPAIMGHKLGNVYEWCYDEYESYAGMATEDPVRSTSSSTAERVVRGGCWFNYARGVRSAARSDYAPTDRYNNLGFRLLRPGL